MSERPLPCPLCGGKSGAVQPIRGRGRSWNIACCDGDDRQGCGLVLFGGDQSRITLVRQWNHRRLIAIVPPSPSEVNDEP